MASLFATSRLMPKHGQKLTRQAEGVIAHVRTLQRGGGDGRSLVRAASELADFAACGYRSFTVKVGAVPLLELGCLLRAYVCLDGCFELSRQACTAAASCLCGDPKLPASSHGAGREHSSSGGGGSVQGSRRDFKLVGDFASKANERAREEVRV